MTSARRNRPRLSRCKVANPRIVFFPVFGGGPKFLAFNKSEALGGCTPKRLYTRLTESLAIALALNLDQTFHSARLICVRLFVLLSSSSWTVERILPTIYLKATKHRLQRKHELRRAISSKTAFPRGLHSFWSWYTGSIGRRLTFFDKHRIMDLRVLYSPRMLRQTTETSTGVLGATNVVFIRLFLH